MFGFCREFFREESGAVTVDWVVMSAAIVGLGLASVTLVRAGVTDLGGDVQSSLSSASVVRLCNPHCLQGLPQALASDRANLYSNVSTAQIIEWHRHRAALLMTQLSQPLGAPTGDWHNLSASEVLDVLYLHSVELTARGAYPVDGVPSFTELSAMYHQAFN